SDRDPRPDLSRSAAQACGIELEELLEPVVLIGLYLLKEPPVQRLVDPAGARAAGVVRQATGRVDGHAPRPSVQYLAKRPSEGPAALAVRHRREVLVDEHGHDRHVAPRQK